MPLIQYILAILPGFVICFYVIKSDRYDPEPMGALLLSFILGTLLILPAILLGKLLYVDSNYFPYAVSNSFISIALVEEGLKLALLITLFYNRSFFNEPFDGIIYSVMIGMGFATAENLLFAGQYNWDFFIQRAFTTELAHGAFSIIMGYYVGKSKAKPAYLRRRFILIALLSSSVLHGIYDFFLMQHSFENLYIFSIICLGVSSIIAFRFIQIQMHEPPFQ